jgi:hypothetical protein
VDRADDDYLSVVAVAESAEVPLRLEPIDPSVGQQDLPVPALDLAPVDDRPGEWLLLGHDRIYRWHAKSSASRRSGCRLPSPSARAAGPPCSGSSPLQAAATPPSSPTTGSTAW